LKGRIFELVRPAAARAIAPLVMVPATPALYLSRAFQPAPWREKEREHNDARDSDEQPQFNPAKRRE